MIVQGTSAMAGVAALLPELQASHLNVKIVYAASPELFALQPAEYREQVLNPADRVNSMVVTTQAKSLMGEWIFDQMNAPYALSADWDNRWRTGGTLDEVLEEAHLSPAWILHGIHRFVQDKDERLKRLRAAVDAARGSSHGLRVC